MAISSDLSRDVAAGPTHVGSGRPWSWHNQPGPLHQLVHAQARLTPDRIAAVYEDEWITYGELVARSRCWAGHLHRQGVGIGTLVGVCLERSLDLPVMILAILEAGGICVPLEPSDPRERVVAMIRETRPPVIVTQHRCRHHLPSTAARLVIVDEDEVEADCQSAAAAQVSPDHLAFVLLTSGSTGVPKGVMVSHASVAARMIRPEKDVPDAGSCMAIMKTPISNSPFLAEMFGPLLHGCYIAIARPEGHQDVAYLGNLIANHGVTHIGLTSTLLRAFLEWPDAARCQSLKAVRCGGDVVSEDLRRRFLDVFPHARFVVAYGTTESGHVMSCECPAGEGLDGTRIGRPNQQSSVELLDRGGAAITPGEIGEIYLGGARVASGYLNRPAWTAERFTPHPFAAVPGERLYRSGDFGRLRADGELEFKGRADQQVKIRANRVELPEVERSLLDCPNIGEAIVLARTNAPGDAQLVAYVAVSQQPGPTVQELREHVAKRLPRFMWPRFFVVLDELPRTTNGKVDRKALMALDPHDHARRAEEYVAPQTPTELILADIWQPLLGIERVGRQDNFFALGGHSILAARACAQIEARLRQKISLSAFFGATNLAHLAEAIVMEQSTSPAVVIVPIQTRGQCPPLFLMPTLSGSPWISSSLLAHWDVQRPVYALGLAGDEAPWGETATVPEIAGYCVAALRDVKFAGPLHIMGHCFGAILAYEVARQLDAAGVEVGRVAIIDMWANHESRKSCRTVLRHAPPFFANLPRWFFNFAFRQPLSKQVSIVRRRIRSWARRLAAFFGGQPATTPIDWWAAKSTMPESLQKRTETFFRALKQYVPGPYSGNVLLFRAKTRPLFHVFHGLSHDLGWGRLVAGQVQVINIPGDHKTMLERPHSDVLATRLQAALEGE